jgi:NAD(P)-dependent dehydrogenase (short-subunit alcohol dehydrogenase family)
LGAYAASKAAVPALLKTIARNYREANIFTYLISPGVVRTAMSEASARSVGGEDAVTSTLTMREWVPPQDIANVVALLAEGTLTALTGSTIDVNGASYIR